MKKLALFSIGFRPFFILASLVAILNPTFWISSFKGYTAISPFGSPLFWHSQEMVFGFTSALIAGFLLTASANWTGTKPVSGLPLISLVLLWIIERISYFFCESNTSFLFASNIFMPIFAIVMILKLIKFKKQNLIFIPILFALFLAKISHSYGFLFNQSFYEQMGLDSGVALIRLIVFVIAGRVLPFFTRVKLSLTQFEINPRVHFIALLPLAFLILPLAEMNHSILIVILGIALLTNFYRNYKLLHPLALRVPMLLVLHVGLNFMLLGLLIELLSQFFPSINQNKESIHATMAGGLGVVAIGIMSRVSLGHTGRPIHADNVTTFAFICVIIGAAIRVFVPLLFPSLYLSSIHYASGFWTLGFIIFLIKNLKHLSSPRPDKKEF